MNFTFRDEGDSERCYEAISVIEFKGTLSLAGVSEGHYTCDVKDEFTKKWFKTNDGRDPLLISDSEVSRAGYVVLFKRT